VVYTDQYTGYVEWWTGGAAFDGYFAASTVYQARLTLSAQDGYTFDGVPASAFSYSGATSVTNAANSGTVTITFPATEAGGGGNTVVNAHNLTGLVTAPVRGEWPVTGGFYTDQYYGSVEWQTSGGTYFSNYFEAGTVYRALVTLYAQDGYTFDGIAADSFIYTGATVTNAANSGTVTITFPATEEAAAGNAAITVGFAYGEIVITGDDGSNVISKTGASGRPTSLTLSASNEYTNVVWYVDGGVYTGGIQDNGNGVTLNAADYTAQRHSITFTGTVNGHQYSSRPIPFTVLN
jgi:hypothetical protein